MDSVFYEQVRRSFGYAYPWLTDYISNHCLKCKWHWIDQSEPAIVAYTQELDGRVTECLYLDCNELLKVLSKANIWDEEVDDFTILGNIVNNLEI